MKTKSERGGGPVDHKLRGVECEPISISKYRLGVGLLLTDDPEAARTQALRSYFVELSACAGVRPRP